MSDNSIVCWVCVCVLQAAPVLVAANHEQKKKFLGRMTAEPLVAVSEFPCCMILPHTAHIHCVYRIYVYIHTDICIVMFIRLHTDVWCVSMAAMY